MNKCVKPSLSSAVYRDFSDQVGAENCYDKISVNRLVKPIIYPFTALNLCELCQ